MSIEERAHLLAKVCCTVWLYKKHPGLFRRRGVVVMEVLR
jgi:hypothetical protein